MPKPIHWKKTTENGWEAPLGPAGAFLFITNGHVHVPGQWVMHFQIDYGARVLDTKVLRATSFETAAKEAICAAKAALKRYISIAKRLDRVAPVVSAAASK
jgi:hypothetical protein